jgi:hypothetical protein
MPGSSTKDTAGGRVRTKLVIVPLLCLGLAAAVPAQVSAPDAQVKGKAESLGSAHSTLLAQTPAPRGGPPAGRGGGRKV